MPQKMACIMPWEMPQEIAQEMLGNRVEGRRLFNKAGIGGNLAFGMGDGVLINQHPARKMAWEMAQEMP